MTNNLDQIKQTISDECVFSCDQITCLSNMIDALQFYVKSEKEQHICIGDFIIERSKGGELWLSRTDGEGMGINEDTFAKAIGKYYDDNF